MTAPLRPLPAEGTPLQDVLDEAVRALAEGKLVALPTETVYGIAARADLPEALEALRALKGRDGDKPFTVALSASTAVAFQPELPRLVERLTRRYWPGPLTLVLRGDGYPHVASDGWTGLRVPAHAGARAVLEAAKFPVALTSANRSGEPPATTADAVAAALPEQLALILDGGPASLAEASTVLALGRGRCQLLRPGLSDLGDLQRTAGLSLLFVCTGNTCRSPLAEALARRGVAQRLDVPAARIGEFGFDVSSAGTFAGPGMPASQGSLAAGREDDLDLSTHASQPALSLDLTRYDRVYCMTRSHREGLLGVLPPRTKVAVDLLDPSGGDVPDPYGGDLPIYRDARDHIAKLVEARLDEWV